MAELTTDYQMAILMIGLTGVMSLLQLLLFDVTAIKLKHPPGFPIESSHKSLLFRFSRTHANTNETIGAMITLFLFTVMSQADPYWVNHLMVVYFCSRVLHMLCYYANWPLFRSVVFGISILALFGLFIVGLLPYF